MVMATLYYLNYNHFIDPPVPKKLPIWTCNTYNPDWSGLPEIRPASIMPAKYPA